MVVKGGNRICCAVVQELGDGLMGLIMRTKGASRIKGEKNDVKD